MSKHPERKTDRIYGEVRDQIKKFAARKQGVTVHDVMLEFHQGHKLAAANLRCAQKNGHIVLKRAATIGCHARPAVYTLAPACQTPASAEQVQPQTQTTKGKTT